MLQDNFGNIWLGTYYDLVKYDREKEIFKHIPLNSPDSITPASNVMIYSMLLDKLDNLWLGTTKGLAKFDIHKEKFKWYVPNPQNPNSLSYPLINKVFEDNNGVIWIGLANGFDRFDKNSETFIQYTEYDGLRDARINSILEDKHGNIWLSSIRGISKFNPVTERFRNYGNDMGLGEYFTLAACSDSSGNFYFGTPDGVMIFHPDSIYVDEHIPQIVLTSFNIFDKPALLDTSILVKKYLELDYQENVFSIEFSALSYINREDIQYAYKLEGFDKDWIYAGSRHHANYMNLDGGTYTFKVKGSNYDGVWNEQGASIILMIKPPFWETWWFRFLVFIVLLTSIGGTLRYIEMRKIKRKIEKLEQERALEHERTRISRDMHDEVGSSLSEIAILSELAKKKPLEAETHINEISERATEVIDSVSEIVWAMNPQNDKLDNLVAHIRRYSIKYLNLSNIECIFSVPEIIPAQHLSTELRRNIFLVVKEALHNIAKHAGASEVLFTIELASEQLVIQIKDNGTGFLIDELSGSGNGLVNMRKRIEDIGGRIKIESSPGEGTQIGFSIKLTT